MQYAVTSYPVANRADLSTPVSENHAYLAISGGFQRLVYSFGSPKTVDLGCVNGGRTVLAKCINERLSSGRIGDFVM